MTFQLDHVHFYAAHDDKPARFEGILSFCDERIGQLSGPCSADTLVFRGDCAKYADVTRDFDINAIIRNQLDQQIKLKQMRQLLQSHIVGITMKGFAFTLPAQTAPCPSQAEIRKVRRCFGNVLVLNDMPLAFAQSLFERATSPAPDREALRIDLAYLRSADVLCDRLQEAVA